MPELSRYAFRSFDRRLAILDNRLCDRIRPDLYYSYAYRSFDRRFALFDNRLGDYLRPSLHRAYGDQQIFMTSLLTAVLGEGPAAVATALIPDLHHFCNRGAKDVIPLWRDAAATQANITTGLLEFLSERYPPPQPSPARGEGVSALKICSPMLTLCWRRPTTSRRSGMNWRCPAHVCR